MRFVRRDARDHIISCQNDHRPSYWRQRALRQQERLRIDFREIFGLLRFSTFATVSALSGFQPQPRMSAIGSKATRARTADGYRGAIPLSCGGCVSALEIEVLQNY